MNRKKVGLVDLDTSHPGAWLPLLRSAGCEVIGVYDGGTVYPAGYAEEFAEKNGIPHTFRSLSDMADAIDIAIIHSCNWDLHVDRAMPFVEARKSVLIDKPLAGNARDIKILRDWSDKGARVTGGSSLWYCREAEEWLREHVSEQIDSIFAGCSVDLFNYGIHAYSLLIRLMGSGVTSCRYLGGKVQDLIELTWSDGRKGIVAVGETKSNLPFYATIVSGSDVTHIQPDREKIYGSMFDRVLPYLKGETDAPPFSLDTLLEAETAALAAQFSRDQGGRKVDIRDVALSSGGYDGVVFSMEYRRQKRQALNK